MLPTTKRRWPGGAARLGLLVALSLPSLVAAAGAAHAATITVTSRADSGPGSLREAVASASAGDTIVLPANASDYAADSAPITIDKSLTIQGAGANNSRVNGGGQNRIFDVTPGASAGVAFEGITITGGGATSLPGGGGVLIESGVGGPITFSGSAVDGNTLTVSTGACCAGGGGIYDAGTGPLTLNATSVSSNTAQIDFTAGCCQGGGGVYSNAPMIISGNSTLSNNTMTLTGPATTDSQGTEHCCSGGGALFQTKPLTVTDATFANNTASLISGDCCQGGGAIMSTDALTLTRVSITGNVLNLSSSSCCSGGGAIQFDPPQGPAAMTIDQSLISGNTAHFNDPHDCCNGGGGIYTDALGGFYNNSTISDNTTNISNTSRPDWGGGGIYELIGGRPDVFTNVTLAGNSAPNGSGGGILNNDGPLSVMDSIFALNTAATGANCFGFDGFVFVSHGYNVENQPDSCNLTGTGDQVVANALVGLAALANNGGPTFTRALQPGSAAINAGDPAGCKNGTGQALTIDERGAKRPQGPRCDAGGFELNANKPRVTTGSAKNVKSSSATVNGKLGPGDLTTTIHFEWGTTTKYGHSSKTQSLGGSSDDRSVSAVLKGLPHNSKIHYRLVGKNGTGSSAGKDRTLTTEH